MAFDPITAALDFGGKLIDKVVPDATAAAQAKVQMAQLEKSGELAQLAGSIQIIVAEAQSGSWLTRSWRPITMLVFLGLVVSWWFGWSPPRASDALILELFGIIKIGLGGYVGGRSIEKVASTIATVVKR